MAVFDFEIYGQIMSKKLLAYKPVIWPKPSLGSMRKPIALAVSGFLLSGVLQANAVESPENFIHVNQIQNLGGSPVTELKPSIDAISSENDYVLVVEAVVENLEELTVCLYKDSLIATNTITELCFDDYLATENTDSLGAMSLTDIGNPKAGAGFATFVPDFQPYVPEGSVWEEADTYEIPITKHLFDNNKPAGESIGGNSSFTLESTIGTQDVATDSIYHVNFAIHPDQRMLRGDDWKVRVSAVYDGVIETVDDTNEYEVKYFSGFDDLNERGQVDYGNLLQNGSVTKSDLMTGKYYANAMSYVNLEANTPFTKEGSTETISLKSSAPNTDENALSLACKAGTEETVFVSTTPARLINSLGATNAQSNPTLSLEADKHSCALSVGSGFELGEYRTDIFVSIGEVVIPPQPPEA